MIVSTSNCFACERQAPPTEKTFPDWSQPRALCVRHKSACRLENGELLSDVLNRVTPRGHALEGGVLARLFNPVYVERDDRGRVKGWTDFAAGGMAVFEDRFDAPPAQRDSG